MLRLLVTVYCALGVGCLWEEESSDGDVPAPDHVLATVTIKWKIVNLAGEPQPCPAGFDTIELLEAPDPRLPNWKFFPCQDGELTEVFKLTPRLPNMYLQVRMMKSSTKEVFTSASTSISGSDSVSFTLVIDAGRARVDWHLKKASGGEAYCWQFGIEQIRLDMIPASGPTLTKVAPCLGGFLGRYEVETDLMLAGRYRFVLTIPSATETRTITVDDVEVPPGRSVSVGPLDVVF